MNYGDKNYYKKSYSSRIFTLGEITDESVNDIIQQIYELNEEDEKKTVKKPIKLIINSPGGLISAGLALIDSIENSNIPINTICHGLCASMGLFVYIAGHNRRVSKRASFMYHDMSWEMSGSYKDHHEFITESKKTKDMLKEFVLSKTKVPSKKLQEIEDRKKDWYITPEEAIQYNIANEII